jgi:hypothetical protein
VKVNDDSATDALHERGLVDVAIHPGTQLLTHFRVHIAPKAGEQLVEGLPVFGQPPL